METKIPGIKAQHAVITPNCRTIPRGNDPVMDAFEAAIEHLREEYRIICGLRDDDFYAHIVLTIEGK